MDRFFSSTHDPAQILYDSNDDDDSQGSTTESLQSWITWFCSLPGHEFYVEVPEDFIEDDFNLTGLSALVPYYNDALEMVLDLEYDEHLDELEYHGEDDFDDDTDEEDQNNNKDADDGFWKEGYHKLRRRGNSVNLRIIEPYAVMLYGLIHQRYLLTRDGQRIMAERYIAGQFGGCPRYYCNNCPVLPCGRYDETGRESVRMYCPNCFDLYSPPASIHHCIDGAHFGTSYHHLLLLNFSELPTMKNHIYQPRIFGFRVNEKSRAGPRMQWIRMRPPLTIDYEDEDEDEDEEDDDDEEEDEQVHDNKFRNVNSTEKHNHQTSRGFSGKDPASVVVTKNQASSSQRVPEPTSPQPEEAERIANLTRQTEGWRIRDSSINSFFRRWL
ncbi:casein kinase II regulatory subunit-domain-containing protein [Radiomyces spectabilis]|uniref:casein kinase II regulatory subunit-domain-containing protein n=1 Tax=Radiomyces spectabilis TaxID=64574 RepID=UPI00221FB1C2|nr:casein kinase II regulatory subunit-domain-containing protein [Radiomyces spectabilis]KAI8394299.1 casein kinase II regulatory subunit-domain-containing protein [Radiomyces spectabilis]